LSRTGKLCDQETSQLASGHHVGTTTRQKVIVPSVEANVTQSAGDTQKAVSTADAPTDTGSSPKVVPSTMEKKMSTRYIKQIRQLEDKIRLMEAFIESQPCGCFGQGKTKLWCWRCKLLLGMHELPATP